MKCYLISYDLINQRDYDSLHEAIKSYGTWAKITESFWAIVTTQSSTQIRDYLKKFMDNDDRIFVIKSGSEAAWTNSLASNEWLKKNLVKV